MSETAASDQVRQFTVSVEDDGIRLDRWFKRNLPDATFNIVSRWSRTGQLRVDGKRAAPGDRIEAGQGLRVHPDAPPATPTPRDARPTRRDDEIHQLHERVNNRHTQAKIGREAERERVNQYVKRKVDA